VKGYGTRLMNHLKQACKRVDLLYYLTYADNFAVGYFKKQGFSVTVSMPREKWAGYIKDYDGGTLMECHYNKKVDHLRVREVVNLQKEAVLQRIREVSNNHLVYPGLTWEYLGGVRQPISVSNIPGIPPEALASATDIGSIHSDDKRTVMHRLKSRLRAALAKIKEHEDAWPFEKPVDPKEVPDYYNVIKNPMDLQTIEHRLENEIYYITENIFVADIRRMCENCKLYNRPETIFYACAVSIESLTTHLFKGI